MVRTMFAYVRDGARVLRSARGLSAVVVATLALALAAGVASFAVLNATLLEALPLREPQRVAFLGYSYAGSPASFSPPTFVDFRREATAFETLSACVPWDANLTGAGEPERVHGLLVSADFFDTLGAAAWRGRTFRKEEELPGRERVVIVSHGLWQRLGADLLLLGSDLRLNGESYQVVGIMAPGFRWARGWGRETQGDVWAPYALTPARLAEEMRGNEYLDVYGRVRPGVALEDAQRDIEAVMGGLRVRLPNRYTPESRWQVSAVALQEAIVGPLRPGLVLVFAAVTSLLLVAATNVAGLLLARAAARRHETSVRAALGASRGRLVWEALAEAGVLAGLGGGFGLVLARAAVGVLEGIDRATLPRSGPFEVDARVVGFGIVATLLAALVSGLVPAWHASRADLMAGLRSRGLGAGGGQARRARRALVVVQTGLALALLVGAGLLVRSLAELHRVPTGFRAADVLTARLQLPPNRYGEPSARVQLIGTILDGASTLPGITAVAAVSELPLSGVANSSSFDVEGQPVATAGTQPHAELWSASPGYFGAMGIALKRGRAFDARDASEAAPVAIVSETLARRYFPGQDPVGRRLDFEGGPSERWWRTIVGVVGDVRDRALDRAPEPQLYVPYSQRAEHGVFVVLRAPGDAQSALPALRAAVRAADPELALFDVAALERLADESARDRQVARTALSGFAGAAALLAALGLYGVVAHSVRERTREMGLRLALGARRSDVVRLILAEGGRLVLVGLAVGILLALAASRLLRGLVFGVTATDPVTYGTVALLLAIVALGACALPAWRASRADPTDALRAE